MEFELPARMDVPDTKTEANVFAIKANNMSNTTPVFIQPLINFSKIVFADIEVKVDRSETLFNHPNM